jgi:hypothetical protein
MLHFKPLTYSNRDTPKTATSIDIAPIITRTPTGQFALPTEFVLLPASTLPLFTTARYWEDGDRLGLTHTKTESSESWLPHVLIEHWEDGGSDGHVEYELLGYAVLNYEDASKYVAAAWAAKGRYDFPQFDIPY